jgi:hypothetical protein
MQTRKTFFAAAVGAILASIGRAQPAPQTRWGIGRLAFVERLPSKPFEPFYHVTDGQGKRVTETGPRWNFTFDESVEIGLRDDGVVVWRKAEAKP